MSLGLRFNGENNFLHYVGGQSYSFGETKAIFTVLIEPKSTTSDHYITRGAGNRNFGFDRLGRIIGSNLNSIKIDGVSKNIGDAIPFGIKIVIELEYSRNDWVNQFFTNYNGQPPYTKGYIFDIKLYRDDILVSHGDFTKGSLDNLAFPSRPFSVEGETIIAEEPSTKSYFLLMDGVDDSLTAPNTVAYDEVEFDCYVDTTNMVEGESRTLFDGRTERGNSQVYYNINGVMSFGSVSAGIWESITINGVIHPPGNTMRNIILPTNERFTINLKFIGSDNGVAYLFKNRINEFSEGKLFDIKFLNQGVVTAHYDMSTGTVLDQSGNGNHATLVGGTWESVDNNPPIEVVENTYLQMDGVDDYILTPHLQFNKIEMDFIVESEVAYSYFYKAFSSYDTYLAMVGVNAEAFTDNTLLYVNNVLVVDRTNSILVGERYTTRSEINTVISDQLIFFSEFSNMGFLKGKLYSLKIYNDTNLVAHYDMSTGTVLDQSGNGNHATLHGGTWITNEESPPTVTEVEYSFHVKQVITKQISNDFHVNQSIFNQLTNDFHVKQVITKQTTDSFHVNQTIFNQLTNDFHITQLITKEHIYEAPLNQKIDRQIQFDFHTNQLFSTASELIFPTKQVIYKETTDNFHITQLITKEHLYVAHMKQTITEQIQSNFPINQLIYSSVEVTFPINQLISTGLEFTFPTKQVVIRDEETLNKLEFVMYRNSETLFPTQVNIFKTDDLDSYTQTVEFKSTLTREMEFNITLIRETEFKVVLTKEMSTNVRI